MAQKNLKEYSRPWRLHNKQDELILNPVKGSKYIVMTNGKTLKRGVTFVIVNVERSREVDGVRHWSFIIKEMFNNGVQRKIKEEHLINALCSGKIQEA